MGEFITSPEVKVRVTEDRDGGKGEAKDLRQRRKMGAVATVALILT